MSVGVIIGSMTRSPSARRAWVEIDILCYQPKCKLVALRKEGVG